MTDEAAQPLEPEAPKKRKKKKLPKIVSAAEMARLMAAADDGTPVGTRNRALLETMYRAGLRVSEACGLTERDVERDGLIRLYEAKGGDGTAYFDPDRVLPHLDRWLAIRHAWVGDAPTLPLFVRLNGDPVSVRYIQRLVKKLKADCGIQGICTPHVLRHTYATELLEEGFTIHEVQAALRHANLATTAVYLHVRDDALRRKMSRRGKEHQ